MITVNYSGVIIWKLPVTCKVFKSQLHDIFVALQQLIVTIIGANFFLPPFAG